MDVSVQERRQAFTHWLRTGRLPLSIASDGVELKFNPYHDPRNGQFTFAPGGSSSPGNAAGSPRRAAASSALAAMKQPAAFDRDSTSRSSPVDDQQPQRSDAVYRPDNDAGRFEAVSLPRNPRASRGSNSRAFQDPLTLAQTFPGLQDQPAGVIVALADNVLDFSGPARELTADLTRTWSNTLINQIKALDPTYRFESLGFPETLEGQVNQLNSLRFERAAAFMRQKAELGPMQVETLRFIQQAADRAYDRGLVRLRAGRLNVRLSNQEALGNYIDREVRMALRERYNLMGIEAAGRGPIRVNRREDDTSGSELTYRRPDARVGNIAIDVTLTQKTLKTQQVRGFFNSDFKPIYVAIIRPRQLGEGSSYIITRPEKR
jgi:hypothetical protein